MMIRIKLLAILSFILCVSAAAQNRGMASMMRETDMAFYKTEEARRIGDQLLVYQRITGGWPKNIDMTQPMSDEQKRQVLGDKLRMDDSTTDNHATNMQMTFLARLYQATKDKKYREAFCRGVEYLLSGQYANGGWPQFWPKMRDYQVHITFNDDAMVNTMTMLRDVFEQKAPYTGRLTTKALREKARMAFDKGVACILRCQIVVDGEPTIWCQQHYRDSYLPAPARSYELASYCPQESAGIVRLLMEIPNPSEDVVRSVQAAMRWFDKHKITGWKVVHTGADGTTRDTRLVEDVSAHPLWARFYDLDSCQPFVCDRDGVPRRHLEEIGTERRNGYSWYGSRPASLYPKYREWTKRNHIEPVEPISVY